jgi:hypothetical protein
MRSASARHGEKILARGFVSERAGAVLPVVEARARDQDLLDVGAAGRARVVERLGEGERRVGMDAAADRAREFRQVVLEARDRRVLERLEKASPGALLRVLGGLELRDEPQRPRPAIRPFERARARPLEVARLRLDRRVREVVVQARADLVG